MSWPQPIAVGPAAFTATTTVFGLLAALSDRYEVAPLVLLRTHDARRLALLVVLAANSAIALFHPLAAALVLALLLTVLAWRLQPARRTREEEAAVEAAIDEVRPREGGRRDR